MTTKEFKNIGRLLKAVYTELENEAVAAGVLITSQEFEDFFRAAQAKIREAVLSKFGFTVEEYIIAKAQAIKEQEESRRAPIEEAKKELYSKLAEVVVPTKDEIAAIAKEEAIKIPPQVTHKTEVIKEIIKEVVQPITITETETIEEKYDDSALVSEIASLKEKLSQLPQPTRATQPQPLNKEELYSEFMEHLQDNINILGMPDFRKLAMGIQGDLDSLRTQVNSLPTSSSGLNIETPTGDVDDNNTTFTVTNEPQFIVVNGGAYTEGVGIYQSYAAGTITLSVPVGSGGFIISFY